MRNKILLLFTMLAFGLTAIQAQTTYSATMAGPLESPPNNSPGGGLGQVTINTTAKTMRVVVVFAQLSGTTTACRIHAPTATANTGTAGVATPTPSFTDFPMGLTSGTYDHTFDMTDAASYNPVYLSAYGNSTTLAFAALSNAISTSKAYINILTTTYTNGEIRGFFSGCTPTYSSQDTAVCANAFPYTWNGIVFNGPGTQPKVYPGGNSQGCDSTAVMTVTQKDTSASYDTVAICNKYTWHDSTYKASGDYTYDTTNAVGCDSVVHLHLTILSVTSNTTKIDASCAGSATGSITVNPTYGVSPFTYRIGTVGNFVNSNTFNGLKAGKYRITIYDANGCAGVTNQVTIGQNAGITATPTVTDAACNGTATGSITVSPTSGTNPYTYKFGTAGSYGPSNTFSNLKAGSYRVYIKDGSGCTSNMVIPVSEPSKVVLNFTKMEETCSGKNDGVIDLSASGGSTLQNITASGYTYRFGTVGPYGTTTHFANLRPGKYRAFVMDAHGCAGASVSITLDASLSPCDPDGKGITRSAKAPVAFSTEKKMSIYPNPATSAFTLLLNNFKTGKAEIVISNESGVTVERRSIIINSLQNNISLNLQNKAAGVYFIKVINEEGVQASKVIIQQQR